MDIEFHYHITGIIANRAGFTDDEAQIIAHACQLVDDNDSLGNIYCSESDDVYEIYISQTMDILKPKRELMRIYPIFHFLPGNPMAPSARRADGKMHILMTTPGNALAYNVMADARNDSSPYRLYRIGVASHAFSDTWAHQNFVGWYDSLNGEAANPLPNIGHADFIHHPDWVGHCWTDSRIVDGQVNNNHRFLDAAKCLFLELSLCKTGADNAARWPALETDLLNAMGPVFSGEVQRGKEARLKAYNALFNIPEYKPREWFDAAIETTVNGLPDTFMPALTIFKDRYQWKAGWQTSDWFLFQQAIKAHQAFCKTALTTVFSQMNVNLSDH